MSVIIFDVEATGLRPGHICQLAYVTADERGVRGRNEFFAVPYMEPAAENVHHLSVEALEALSGGRTFETVCWDVLRDFNEAEIVISHNYAFDSNFMRAEAGYAGAVYTAKGFCTMNRFRDLCRLPGLNGRYKNPKLDELADHFRIDRARIPALTRRLFGTDQAVQHDARYDAALLCAVVARAYASGAAGLDYPVLAQLDALYSTKE